MARASIDLATTMLAMLLLIRHEIEPRLLRLRPLRRFAYRRFYIRLMWQLRHRDCPNDSLRTTGTHAKRQAAGPRPNDQEHNVNCVW